MESEGLHGVEEAPYVVLNEQLVPPHENAGDEGQAFDGPVSDAVGGVLAKGRDETLLGGFPVDVVILVLGKMETESLVDECCGRHERRAHFGHTEKRVKRRRRTHWGRRGRRAIDQRRRGWPRASRASAR